MPGASKLRVIADTNAWISRFILPNSLTGQRMKRLAADKRIALVFSQALKEELRAVKGRLLSFGDYQNIEHRIDLSHATDQPETKIFMAVDGKRLATSIYGLGIKEGLPAKSSNADSPELPESIKKLYSYILSTDLTGAREWTPTYVEAMVWGYDYATDESVRWPKGWPGLSSPFTNRRRNSYSIFLPGSDRGKLSVLLLERVLRHGRGNAKDGVVVLRLGHIVST